MPREWDTALMTPGQRMRKECETRLRQLVTADERIVAVGTADEFPEPTGDLGVQGRWRFLLVTSERLLFADWSKPDRPHEDITFDEVARWADGVQYHRYAITMTHPPLTRDEFVSAHRFLWFKWGDASKPGSRSSTTLRFSHRDTAAAKSLRAALEQRHVPHETLLLKEVSREERTRGSHVTLTPDRR